MSANQMAIYLHRQPDGSFVDWGRSGTGKHRGEGPARWYTGEAAEVMRIVLANTKKREKINDVQS